MSTALVVDFLKYKMLMKSPNFLIIFKLYEFEIFQKQNVILVESRFITRIGYNAVSRGPRISAGATANNNAYLMKSSCLSCTGVSRNILIILRNLTQKYNYVAEFIVCYFIWLLLCSQLRCTKAIVFHTDLLCN